MTIKLKKQPTFGAYDSCYLEPVTGAQILRLPKAYADNPRRPWKIINGMAGITCQTLTEAKEFLEPFVQRTNELLRQVEDITDHALEEGEISVKVEYRDSDYMLKQNVFDVRDGDDNIVCAVYTGAGLGSALIQLLYHASGVDCYAYVDTREILRKWLEDQYTPNESLLKTLGK